MNKLLLVRHGETEWNVERRIQGWAPVELSKTGQKQAECVGKYLDNQYDIDLVVTSDLRRTVQTANIIADVFGQSVEKTQLLRERHFGVYQGLLSDTFFERFPEMDVLENGQDAVEYTPESGESWLDVHGRVFDAINDLEDRTGTIVVVSHVNPIRLILGNRIGKDIISSLTELSVNNCSVSEINSNGEIVFKNEIDFLTID